MVSTLEYLQKLKIKGKRILPNHTLFMAKRKEALIDHNHKHRSGQN